MLNDLKPGDLVEICHRDELYRAKSVWNGVRGMVIKRAYCECGNVVIEAM